MILGPLQLPTICVVNLTGPDAWSYATHDVIEGKQRRQFVAEVAPTRTLSLMLHREWLDTDATVATLKSLAAAHEVLVLQDKAGTILGRYVIEGVNDAPIWTLPDGFVVCRRVEVQLADPGVPRELVPAPKPVAVVGGSAPTTATPKAEDTTRDPNDVPAAEIARL